MEAIRKIRIARGMTQEDLAKKLGLSRTTVTFWELGVNNPRTNMIPALAKALKCDIADLFCSKP